MLYLYDQAICDDLIASFNTNVVDNPVVKVFDPESIVGLVAQIQEDTISFPVIAIERDPTINIDTERSNFTRMHRGVHAVFDKENNLWYNERAVPITLSYSMSIITTNTADMDELVRELIFKYTQMYFLTIRLPYESDRKLRFGIKLDDGTTIERQSAASEYYSSGQLYRTKLQLNCEGCVLLSYTPIKLKRQESEIEATVKNRRHRL